MRIDFGSFALDLDTRQLRRDGVELHLTPKAFALLTALALERPNAVSKATLLERLWPGTSVVEANLSNLVSEIRGVLSDRTPHPKWLRTARGFGYAFCGNAVTRDSADMSRTLNP